VGIEVHHIVQPEDGGDDSLSNSITLCFDCHCAAGHYNSEHPRGNKFSPEELRRHRGDWWEKVKVSGIADLSEDNLPDYYVRHLISLDNEAAKEIFDQNKKNLPFDFTYLINNQVGKFMKEVLSDDLPFTWATSESEEGLYWKENSSFENIEDFLKANPEFKGRDNRPLVKEDFDKGGIKSKLLQSCFKEGMPTEEIGNVHVEVDLCGGPTVFSYYSLRRPIFIFALIQNKSKEPIILDKLLSRRRETVFVEPINIMEANFSLKGIECPPIRIEFGQSVLIPEMVLLSSPHEDDYSYFFKEYENISREKGQEIRFGSAKNIGNCDYWLVGPCGEINGFEGKVNSKILSFPVHRFDPNTSFSIARFWNCGSCPHVFFQKSDGQWIYSQEILSRGYNEKDSALIEIPSDIVNLMISEIEFEVTTVSSITINGQELLKEPRELSKGESLRLKVKSGDLVFVEGSYTASIPYPKALVHFRQKATLLKTALYELNS